MSKSFTITQAKQALAEDMPGCVRELGISVEKLAEGAATLRMPANDMSCRQGGMFSGQALAGLADTAMCFAIWSDGRGYRSVATVDLHLTFLRGGGSEDVLAHAEIVKSGRLLSFCKVSMVLADSGKELASAVATFSLPT